MFTAAERDRTSDHVIAMASADPDVVGGAVVGSLALGAGDAWSDLDLMFALRAGAAPVEVLGRWQRTLERDLGALHLFDLASGAIVYLVMLLPGGLQLDLSCVPAAAFGPGGPRFRLLFGQTVNPPPAAAGSAHVLFGWAVAYARDARACIERGRPWQAQHCIDAVRDHALSMASLRLGLPARFGRGFDDLPEALLASFASSLAGSLDPAAQRLALTVVLEGLIAESLELGTDVCELAVRAAPHLRQWLPAV